MQDITRKLLVSQQAHYTRGLNFPRLLLRLLSKRYTNTHSRQTSKLPRPINLLPQIQLPTARPIALKIHAANKFRNYRRARSPTHGRKFRSKNHLPNCTVRRRRRPVSSHAAARRTLYTPTPSSSSLLIPQNAKKSAHSLSDIASSASILENRDFGASDATLSLSSLSLLALECI